MPEPFKETLFSRAFFDALVAAFQAVYPPFDAGTFLARIYDDQWEGRELKARMRHTTLTLHDALPDDYCAALDLIRRAAPALDAFPFGNMVFPDYVEVYGLDDWDASIPALEQFTQRSSAEFAVRPFILAAQDRMMAQMLSWAGHEVAAVRRLASEGCRPRLPWAIALPAFKVDPSPILPILERLKCDESEAVRRSVANNLNDISKDNPQVTIDVLRRWQNHDVPDGQSMAHHALRTLAKAGHPDALDLLGFGKPQVAVNGLIVEPDVVPQGGEVRFSFEVESLGAAAQDLMIDYAVHLMRANGKQTRKVFKLTKKTLAPGEKLSISRQFSFRPITTRRYYPGEHAISVQVNGTVFAEQAFEVEA